MQRVERAEVDRAREQRTVVRRSRVETVVAQTRAPARGELVDALQVPARLRVVVGRGYGRVDRVEDEVAALRAAQVLRLHLELAPRRRRPLELRVRDPGL